MAEYESVIWPTLPDGDVALMSFGGDAFTLYDIENTSAWVSADEQTCIQDITNYR